MSINNVSKRFTWWEKHWYCLKEKNVASSLNSHLCDYIPTIDNDLFHSQNMFSWHTPYIIFQGAVSIDNFQKNKKMKYLSKRSLHIPLKRQVFVYLLEAKFWKACKKQTNVFLCRKRSLRTLVCSPYLTFSTITDKLHPNNIS